jgi:hypothetical protein
VAYLSRKDGTTSYFPIMLMGIRVVPAIVGVAAVASDK